MALPVKFGPLGNIVLTTNNRPEISCSNHSIWRLSEGCCSTTGSRRQSRTGNWKLCYVRCAGIWNGTFRVAFCHKQKASSLSIGCCQHHCRSEIDKGLVHWGWVYQGLLTIICGWSSIMQLGGRQHPRNEVQFGNALGESQGYGQVMNAQAVSG